MPAVGTWRHVLTALFLLMGLVLLFLGVRVIHAQEDSQTERQSTPDHYYYQFFGYAADVTIDGEPLQVGDSITPIINGNAVTPAVVAENGFFLTFKHLYEEPPIGECKVVYELHSQRRGLTVRTEEYAYAPGCGDIRVAVALSSATEGSSNGAQAAVVSDHADDADSGVQADAPETSSRFQRPEAPRTGTGGVYDREAEANWPVVAGVLFLLVSAIGLMTVTVKRRTDHSPE